MASNEPPTQDVDVEHALSASPVVVAEPAEMRADVEQQQQHEVDAGLGPSMSDKHTEEQHQQQLDNRVNPLFELSQAVTAGDLDEVRLLDGSLIRRQLTTFSEQVHVFKVSDGHVVLRQGTPPTLFARLAPDAAAQRAQASTSSSSNVANNALASSSVASTLFQHQHSRNASVSSVSSSSKRGIRRRTTSRTSSSYDTAVSTPAAATQAGCHPDAMEVAHLRVQPPQHSHSDEVRMRTLHARNEVRAWPHSSSSAPSSSSSSSASSSSSTHTAEADPQVAQALDHPASPPRIDTAFSSAHDAITDSPVTYSSSAPPMLAPSAPSRVRRHTTATQARAVPLTTVSPPTPDDGAHQDDSETRSDSLSDVRSDARSERSERSGPARSGDVPRANVPRRAYTATAGDVSTSAWAASRAQLVPPAPAPTPVVPSPPQRTTSPTPRARRASSYAASSTFASRRPSDHAVLAADDDIEGNIAAHAESIRAQRAKKRAASSDDEDVAAAARRKEEATEKKPEKPERPLVGNLIGTDHANYVLMYNMLTGIRIAVSRCQAKPQRAITDADYTARHKYSFDIVGNELTPSTRYDFKFKDYAPWVFRELREYFYLDPSDYLVSLTAKYILSELGSPGKSGSFFYFSRDYRFIIKTIRHSEHKFLRSILRDYHEHVKQNPHTLISRFYGLHRVKLPRGRKIHFVIMNNLFPPHRDIHETYDLKVGPSHSLLLIIITHARLAGLVDWEDLSRGKGGAKSTRDAQGPQLDTARQTPLSRARKEGAL